NAPDLTRHHFGMDLVEISYDELGRLLLAAPEDRELLSRCREAAEQLIQSEQVSLESEAGFVEKAFLLTEVFHRLLAEHKTDAITINLCMGTIMEVSGTTACLPLSLLNDAGYLAFCESDFVVIPSGVLLHYISGKPVFFNDPTYPHDNLVTLAHCTAPRRMDGETLEPVRLLTHFESDWGVAPKVEMKLGQKMTVIDPDFNFKRWMGFEAEIVENPFLDICRSQIDVEFRSDTDRINEETRGFHWMACYGGYLRETEYAVRKAGIDWLKL
ncbi:MAG: sugar isomerase, partial [Acidobacteriota bacterium]